MKEVFKPVPYKPFDQRYSVSNLGRVRVDKKSKFSGNKADFLRYGIGARGYPCVTLYDKGNHKQCFVHRMVAYAFLGDPPEGKNIVCHLDDNKLNNVTDNLIWGSPTDNMRLMIEHDRQNKGTSVNTAKLDSVKVLTIRKLYGEGSYTQAELATTFGVCQTTISRIILRQNWKNVL